MLSAMPAWATMPPKFKPSLKGKEIVDPQMAVFIKLDDLQRVLKKELTSQRDVMVQLLNTELISQEHLKAITKQNPVSAIPVVEKLEQIRAQLVERRDEGDYYYEEGTATTTEHILDLNAMWGYPVKGYILKNDSKTNIRAAHVSRREVSIDFAPERFYTIRPREEFVTPNNIKVVWKLILKTDAGTADYRLWLLW